ncbi:MAG: preprotein translocase subunit SecE [Candidatus Omnitrophota bacterium]
MIKIGIFIGQVRGEMRKVSWPSRPELLNSTIIVLVTTLMLAVFIGLCDVVISRIVNVLIRGVF